MQIRGQKVSGTVGTLQAMIDSYPEAPPRLAPFLAQWDYVSGQLMSRLEGLQDDELLWEPAVETWSVRARDGDPVQSVTDSDWWDPTPDPEPPRTLAWSIGHLGAGSLVRADWLVGDHRLLVVDEWPMTAHEAVEFLKRGLDAWRTGLDQMSDEDLDTVGRSAYPEGLDPTLPLIDIVWWVNKELLWHSAEIWYVRDLYAYSVAREHADRVETVRAPGDDIPGREHRPRHSR